MVGGSARLFRSRVVEARNAPVTALHVNLRSTDRLRVPREAVVTLLARAAERGAACSVACEEPLCAVSHQGAVVLWVSDGTAWIGKEALSAWVTAARPHSYGGTWLGVTGSDDAASGKGLRVLVTDGHEHCGEDGPLTGWGSWSLAAEVQRRGWLVACPCPMPSAFWRGTPQGARAVETWRSLHRALGLPM